MRIGGGGSTDINLLQSDAAQFRNKDFVVSQDGAFIGSSVLQAAVSRFPVIQLFNPVGSGVTIIIDHVDYSGTTTQTVSMGFHNIELADDRGAWINQRAAGGAGQGHIRDENFNAATITEFASYFAVSFRIKELPFEYPFILAEGEGLAVQGLTVTTLITVGFYGREV